MKISDAILYNNNQLIALNKQAGQLVQSGKDDTTPLVIMARMYCKHPVHVIHRLDRPASGIVLFAKTRKALVTLNHQFRERKVKKTYLAVVGERPETDSGQLHNHLEKMSDRAMSQVIDEPTDTSREAILNYTYLCSIENYHLLEIELITGRYHQIRVQLANIGCPIKGDDKYGFKRGNPDRSIHLHAWKLEFFHPVTSEPVHIRAPLPDDPVWNAFKETCDQVPDLNAN